MTRRRKNQKALLKLALDSALDFTGTHHGSSRWSEYRRCPKAHYLRMELGVRPIERPDYFGIGSIVHAGLAFAGLCEMEKIPWKLSQLLAEAEKRKLFERDIIQEGRRLLSAYFAQWGTDNASYGEDVEIIEVEHYVRVKLAGLPYTGRIDTLLETTTSGALIIVDHKTTSSMPRDDAEEVAEKYKTRSQFCGLAYALREIEDELPMFMVNIICKTIIPKFRRIPLQFTDTELDRWAFEHERTVRTMKADEKNGVSDRMNYDACAPVIGPECWAYRFCHGSDEERKELFIVPEGTLNKKARKHGNKKKEARTS